MNTSQNNKALRWCALTCAGVFALAAASSAQVLFDFESDLEGWYLNQEETNFDAINSVLHDDSGLGATSGSGAMLYSITMPVGAADPFSWAFRVDVEAGTAVADAVNAAQGQYFTFDVVHVQDFTPGYNDVFQLFAVFQPGGNGWVQTDNIWPEETTLDSDFTQTISVGIPTNDDFADGFNFFVGIKAAIDVAAPDGIYLFFDNFRITEEPAGGGAPVTEEPVTEEPVTEEPVTEEPVTEEPVTEEPVTEEPTPQEWFGYAVEADWAHTGGWIGAVYVPHSPWVYQSQIGWLYVSTDSVSETGAWMFAAK